MKREKDEGQEFQLVKVDLPVVISQGYIDTVKLAVVDAEEELVQKLVSKASGKLDPLVDGSNDRILGRVFAIVAGEAKNRVNSNFRQLESILEGFDFSGMPSSDTAA